MASFIYFAEVLAQNDMADNIPEDLKTMFRKLSFMTQKYQKHLDDVILELNAIIKPIDKDVDFMLMSVSLITEYYRQMRGKKRHFTPLSYDDIVTIEDECIEMSKLNVNDTFDVAEIIVEKLLESK